MKRIHSLIIVAILGLLVLGTAQPARAGTQPDLTVIGATSVVTGGQWYLKYTISNKGTASSGTFMITLKDSAGAIKQSLTTPSLSPGSTMSFLHPTGGCKFYRTIIVDSTNVVFESNELNNTRGYDSIIDPEDLC